MCLWRCQDAEAFELSSSGFTNGVFVKFLKKRLLDDEKITVVLDRVAEGENRNTTSNIYWDILLQLKTIANYRKNNTRNGEIIFFFMQWQIIKKIKLQHVCEALNRNKLLLNMIKMIKYEILSKMSCISLCVR